MRMTLRIKEEGRDAASSISGAPRKVPVNLSLPEDLVEQLDSISGPRNRSAFVEDAVRRAIRRERLRISIERYAGSLSAADYPHWRTSEDVVSWVRMMRAEETSWEVDAD